jgi:hypothetical protein
VDSSRFSSEIALMLLGSFEYSHYEFMLYNPYCGTLGAVSEAAHAEEVDETAHKEEEVETAHKDEDAEAAHVDEEVKGAHADEDVEATGAEQKLPSKWNSSNAVQIIAHETLEDSTGRLEYSPWNFSNLNRYFTLKGGQSLTCGLGLPHGYSYSKQFSEKELKLWTQATVAIHQEPQKYLVSNERLRFPTSHLKMRSGNFQDTGINIKDIQASRTNMHANMDDPLFWIMLIALPIVYGSVHLIAWNFTFPTYTEKMMWRVACILIAGGIPFTLIMIITLFLGYIIAELLFEKYPWWERFTERFTERTKKIILIDIFGPSRISVIAGLISLFSGFISLFALYFGARLFIIIESFISIRRLPLGVFLTVNWSTYIPHL